MTLRSKANGEARKKNSAKQPAPQALGFYVARAAIDGSRYASVTTVPLQPMNLPISPRSRGGITIAVLLVLALSFTRTAVAQTATEDLSLFGFLGQGGAPGSQQLKDNSCVPTATSNSLTFLDNYQASIGNQSTFTFSPNSFTEIGDLQAAMGTTPSGTTTTGQFNGLQNYLGATGANPAPQVSIFGQYSPLTPAAWIGGGFNAGIGIQNVTPTPDYLAFQLNFNRAVEVGIQWGTYNTDTNTFNAARGGHELSLYSISYNAALNSGTIGFVDPWGTGINHGGTVASSFIATFQVKQGYMYVTYPTVVADGDTLSVDKAGDGSTGRILDISVQAVPDAASTFLLSLLAFGALFAVQRRARNC